VNSGYPENDGTPYMRVYYDAITGRSRAMWCRASGDGAARFRIIISRPSACSSDHSFGDFSKLRRMCVCTHVLPRYQEKWWMPFFI